MRIKALIMAIGIAIANNQFGRLDGRIDQLGNKIETIPQRLSDEFRAMRAEVRRARLRRENRG